MLIKALNRLKLSGLCFTGALAILVMLSLNARAQFYYGSQMEFGKNRVQYNSEFWSLYKFNRFDIYFYLGGKNLAIYTAKTAESYLENLELMLDYPLEDQVQFVIYNKQSDYKQSNMGLTGSEAAGNIGGTTRIVGSKIILYYEGDHDKLSKQIKAGLAEVVFNQMMYAGSWKDVLRNSTLLTVPDWYSKGFASYYSNNWSPELDNYVKDGIKTHDYKQLNRLTGQEAIYAGHSLWNYIGETYGKNVIPNILYMTRVSRNIESGFLFVLGVSLKNIMNDWTQFYQNKYLSYDLNRNMPSLKEDAIKTRARNGKVYSQFKLSPDNTMAVFATHQQGQYKIYLQELSTGKRTRIYKREQKLPRVQDVSYPILNWHPTGEFFTFITEEEGEIRIHYYKLKEKEIETRPILNFEKILSYQYSPDGKKFVMSAVQNGFTDIFVFNVASNNAEQITKDIYDDLYPCFFKGTNEIVFSSNRNNDTLKFSDAIDPLTPFMDLYSYDYLRRTPLLKRLTESNYINETWPLAYDAEHIVFRSDYNGIENRFLGSFDSVLVSIDTTEHYRHKMHSYPITNNARNLIAHSTTPQSEKISEIIFADSRFHLRILEKPKASSVTPQMLTNTSWRELSQIILPPAKPITQGNNLPFSTPRKELEAPKDSLKQDSTMEVKPEVKPEKNYDKVTVFDANTDTRPKEKSPIDINNYSFNNDKPVTTPKDSIKTNVADTLNVSNAQAKEKTKEFRLPKQQNYNRYFTVDYFVTQLDNSFLNANYQKFNGGGPVYYNPGFNGLMKIGSSDLFEDYRLYGGVRLSTDLKSNEFLVGIDDLSKRWDRTITFHRRALNNADSDNPGVWTKVHTQEVKYSIKYPFNEVLAWKSSIAGRNDRTVYLANDATSLKRDHEYDYWATLKTDLTFDNTRSLGLNLPLGFRSKLFAEYYRQVDKKQTNLFVLGADGRFYQKIFREFIWANRIAASTSFGNQKLIYYMGGVDNWILPKYKSDNEIRNPQQYAFQTLATNMRGFIQNSRNGNSFAVASTEFRMPLFKVIANRPLRSDFLNNFQFIVFGDVGTAWTGKSPFAPENSIFTTTLSSPNVPVDIILRNQLNPIIGGYGWGLRARLLGYFIRLDWAHGVQDGLVQKRVFYISLNTDF